MPTRSAFLVLAALLALVLAGCSSSGGSESPTPSPTAGSHTTIEDPTPAANGTPAASDVGPASVDAERVFEHIRVLSVTIGPRVAGSAAEREAVDYIAGQFTASGYTVELNEFGFAPSAFRYGSVDVGGAPIEALALVGSPGGTASGRVIYVGTADEASVAGLDLTGAIAVADRDRRTFRDKLITVRDAGAAGLIIINHSPGPFTGQLQLEAPFPVVGVGAEDRDVVIAATESGQEITVTVPDEGLAQSVNVIARADPDAACEVLVGGHHDSVPGAPGANDNASGTAHVIELARVFAADGLDPGLCFATFGAEEFGLFGSQALAREWAQAEVLPRYMVNLDVTGAGDTIELIGDSSLVPLANALADGLRIAAHPATLPPNASSDHVSFATFGSEVILVSSSLFANIHTPADVIDDIDLETLDRIGRLTHALVAELLAEIAAD